MQNESTDKKAMIDDKKPVWKSWDLFSISKIPGRSKKSWQFIGKGFDRPRTDEIEIHQNFISSETKLQLRLDKPTQERIIEIFNTIYDEMPTHFKLYGQIVSDKKIFWVQIGLGFLNQDCSINLLTRAQTIGTIKLVPMKPDEIKKDSADKSDDVYDEPIPIDAYNNL